MEDCPCERADHPFHYIISADRDCQGSAGNLRRQFTILSGNLTKPDKGCPAQIAAWTSRSESKAGRGKRSIFQAIDSGFPAWIAPGKEQGNRH